MFLIKYSVSVFDIQRAPIQSVGPNNRIYKYPGLRGAVSCVPAPFSFLTSFSLLRLKDSRSFVKEPLRFKLSYIQKDILWGMWFGEVKEITEN